MNESQLGYGIVGLISIISIIVGFALNVSYENYKERIKARKENMKIHFEEIKEQISRLSRMARGLTLQHDGLIFEESVDGYSSDEPISEHYKFEEYENFLSFEIHFPNRAREWKLLKGEAVTLKKLADIVAKGESDTDKDKYENARKRIGDDLFPLQHKFRDFAQRLTQEIETISKYQIGTVFKYNKKCPICKKF